MSQLSNRAYAWIMCILISLLIVGAALWRLWPLMPTIGHYALIGLIILAVITVLVVLYLAWHKFMLHHYDRQSRKQQLQLEADAAYYAREREVERVEIERQREADKLALEQQREAAKLQLEREKIRLEQMKATLEHERFQAAQRAVLLNPGQTAIFPDDEYYKIESAIAPAALPGRQAKEQIAQYAQSRADVLPEPSSAEKVEVVEDEEKEILVPVAPSFWDIADLITAESMPLCFVVDDNPESQYYGQTVPQFGTIDDLLSLAVIGKPGRGKTVLLMYYSLILLAYGAEIHIFDPHGVMGELALLHGRPLPGMPATARIYYYDRKDTMMPAVAALKVEMLDRDVLYRPHLENGQLVSRKTRHPLLILADELPILAEFDSEVRLEYKERNHGVAYGEREEVPSLIHLIKRTVLEARKWRMFFIGSAQSIDASILPTKVTDALNSRIVFFNSDRKARMVGLEADVIKKMLPLIRRAGPGMTIYDCARWDGPKIGAIPFVSVEDMLQFLGIDLERITESWIVESGATEAERVRQLRLVPNEYRTDANAPTERLEDDSQNVPSVGQKGSQTVFSEVYGEGQNVPHGPANGPVAPLAGVQNEFQPGPGEKVLSDVQKQLLAVHYADCHDVKECLRRLKLGVGTYYSHACFVLDGLNLRKKRA